MNKRSKLIKDKKFREKYKEKEMRLNILKSIGKDYTMKGKIRYEAFLKVSLVADEEKSYRSSCRNYCHKSMRGKGIVKEYGLSRQEFKKRARSGYLVGVIRSPKR